MAKTVKIQAEVQCRETYAVIKLHINEDEYVCYVNQHGTFNETVYTSVDSEGQTVLAAQDVPNILRIAAEEQFNKIKE